MARARATATARGSTSDLPSAAVVHALDHAVVHVGGPLPFLQDKRQTQCRVGRHSANGDADGDEVTT